MPEISNLNGLKKRGWTDSWFCFSGNLAPNKTPTKNFNPQKLHLCINFSYIYFYNFARRYGILGNEVFQNPSCWRLSSEFWTPTNIQSTSCCPDRFSQQHVAEAILQDACCYSTPPPVFQTICKPKPFLLGTNLLIQKVFRRPDMEVENLECIFSYFFVTL